MLEDIGITKRQTYGGIGESETEAKLKFFSQVFRPVPLFEYSIDFYCKLLLKGRPSNKSFWVEVKSTNQVKDAWKKSIRRETALFWLDQLSPVFIAVYDISNDVCYWISVEANRELWTKKLNKNSKSITLKVDKSHVLKKAKDPNSEFIQKIEQDTILVNAANGIPEVFLKGGTGITPGYAFFDFPNIELSERARNKFAQRIRFSLNFLIRDHFSRKDLDEAYRLCRILTDFDKAHYDHFELMGDICQQLEKYEEARTNYDFAIKKCKDDPNWDKNRVKGVPKISEVISGIEQKKASLPLHSP